MVEQILKNKKGQLLGKIKDINGIFELRDNKGQLLGRYNPKTNQTRDSKGRLIGRGNLLTMLING